MPSIWSHRQHHVSFSICITYCTGEPRPENGHSLYSGSAEDIVTRAVTHQVGSLNNASSSRNTAWEEQVRDGREEVYEAESGLLKIKSENTCVGRMAWKVWHPCTLMAYSNIMGPTGIKGSRETEGNKESQLHFEKIRR